MTRLLILCLLLAPIHAACGDPTGNTEDPAHISQAAKVEGSGVSGSSVYLGEGILLTNWHIAVSSALLGSFEGLDPELFLRHYNSPSSDQDTILDQFYCLNEENDFFLSDTEDGSCRAINLVPSYIYELAPPQKNQLISARLLYANIELDLAIVEVESLDEEGFPEALPTMQISTNAPDAGQGVLLTSFPGGGAALTEDCALTSQRVEALRDPDTSFPSELIVPSFVVDCFSVQGGSSGAPVVDADSGLLLGLVWTRDPATGEALISAASGWKDYLENPSRTTDDSQLQSLLDRFGAD